MADVQEIKVHLLKSDLEFQELAHQHHALDERLHQLASRHYLSENEHFEEVEMKKQKLRLKDRMEDILRRYQM
jgi:uncharacterized protein YdcH (DUF465 family)